MDKIENENLYVFWSYSEYPYILGGKVDRFCDSGRAYVNAYQMQIHNPIAFLPGDEGERAMVMLKELTKNYKNAESLLRKNFTRLIQEINPMFDAALKQK